MSLLFVWWLLLLNDSEMDSGPCLNTFCVSVLSVLAVLAVLAVCLRLLSCLAHCFPLGPRSPTLISLRLVFSSRPEREGEAGTPGGPEREAEGSDRPAQDPARRSGAVCLSGGQLRLTAPVGGHGETKGRISHRGWSKRL